jgi:hypothetical protein
MFRDQGVSTPMSVVPVHRRHVRVVNTTCQPPPRIDSDEKALWDWGVAAGVGRSCARIFARI